MCVVCISLFTVSNNLRTKICRRLQSNSRRCLGTGSPNLWRGPISTIDMGMRVPISIEIWVQGPHIHMTTVSEDSVTASYCFLGLISPYRTQWPPRYLSVHVSTIIVAPWYCIHFFAWESQGFTVSPNFYIGVLGYRERGSINPRTEWPRGHLIRGGYWTYTTHSML